MATVPPVVVLAIPDALLTSSLASALSPSCRVAATVASWGELEDALDGCHPEVVVTDIVVGGDPVLAHLHQLVVAHPKTHFVVCTSHHNGVIVQAALLAGATAVVGHDVDVATLSQALCVLAADGHWPAAVGTGAARHSVSRAPLRMLTPRLHQISDLLWQRCTHQQIATKLGIAVKTVEAHLTEIRQAYAVAPGMPGPWEEPGRRGRRKGG